MSDLHPSTQTSTVSLTAVGAAGATEYVSDRDPGFRATVWDQALLSIECNNITTPTFIKTGFINKHHSLELSISSNSQPLFVVYDSLHEYSKQGCPRRHLRVTPVQRHHRETFLTSSPADSTSPLVFGNKEK